MSLATLYSPAGNRNLVITQYSIGFTGVQSQSQAHLQMYTYPIRMRQDPFKFTVQCRNEVEKEGLVQYIRAHQAKSVSAWDAGKTYYAGQLRFFWMEERLDFLGYIKSVHGGAVRFQQAPTMDFEMLLVKDLVFSVSSVASSGDPWTGVYDGEVSIDPPATGGVTHWVAPTPGPDGMGSGYWAPGPAPVLPVDPLAPKPGDPGPNGF